MELLSTFMNVKGCPVLKFGLKKIPMDYYFCKDCDKEEKFPMCHSCIKKCHKGHSPSEKHPASSSNLIRCSCAMINHQTTKQEVNEELTTCYFYELNKTNESLYCYENTNGNQICEFCYCFCKPNSHDESEFKLPFNRVKLDLNSFQCRCPTFKNSKHTTVDFMYKCLGDINRSTEFYFSHISPVILLNIFFNSEELFHAINKKFIDVFKTITKEDKGNSSNLLIHSDSIESASSTVAMSKIPGIISQTYSIWRKNAKNCKNEKNLYFCKEIEYYYQDKIFKTFFQIFDSFALVQKSNIKNSENFYESFLYGYKLFNVWSKLNKLSLPKLKLDEFINLNPYQRIMMMSTAKENSKETFDVNYITKLLKTLIRESSSFCPMKIILQLFSLVKVYASFYLFSNESINDFCKAIENFFINIENIRNETIEESTLMIKLFKKIMKILIYFSFYYNDMVFISKISEIFEQKNTNEHKIKIEKNSFVYSDNEIPRNIAKNIIHVTKFLESEYSNCQPEEKKKYTSLIELIQVMVNISFNKKDIYSNGIQRLLNPFSEEIGKYIIKEKINTSQNLVINLNEEFKRNVSILNEENEKLNQKISEYYCQFSNDRSIRDLVLYFENSIDKILNIFSLNNSREVLSKNATENAIKNSEDVNELKNLLQSSAKKSNNTRILMQDSGKKRLLTPIKEQKENFIHSHSKTNVNNINEPIDSVSKMNDTENERLQSQFRVEKKNECAVLILSDNVHVIDLSYYIYTITKIFSISEVQKDIFSQKFCSQVYLLFNTYMNAYSEHSIFCLTSQIFTNLSDAPLFFLPKVFTLFKKGIQFLNKNKKDIGCLSPIIKIINDIFTRRVPKNDVPLFTLCLCKLEKIIYELIQLSSENKSSLLPFIKENIFSNCEIAMLIKSYKEYLLDIAKDFKINETVYKNAKSFQNETIFRKYFKNSKIKTMYKVFLYYTKIINALYDGKGSLSDIEFIQNSISSGEVASITSILTLDITLRIELIQLFRITYIDTLIDSSKLNLYRTEFQNNDEKLEENFFSSQQNRIFTFYDRLMSVNGVKTTKDEYNFLLFEVMNFGDIINYSDLNIEAHRDLYIEYFEDAIILPLVIYLNKIFAMIPTFPGKDILPIYKLTNYILQMLKTFNELGGTNFYYPDMSSRSMASKRGRKNSISKTITKLNETELIEKDLKSLTDFDFNPFNYLSLYQILAKHLITIFDHPGRNIKSNGTEFEIEDSNDIPAVKQELIDNGLDFGTEEKKNEYICTLFDIYVEYLEGKFDFQGSSIKAILDLNYGSDENTFRSVLCKYLLVIMTDDVEVFAKESLIILLNLLRYQTSLTQNALLKLSEDQQSYPVMKIIIEKCFMNILSTILSQFNPALNQFNDDYYNSCAFIKFFKFLCEEHNQHFQKFFLKKFFFSLNDIQKISFYDMMLYVLEKIITLSCWEQVKVPEDFHHYFVLLFSCIVELLIEIIQGTEDSNFLSLINQKFDGNQRLMINANRMDPVLKKGKAFDSFLKCVKNLIISDDQNSEELDSIRKMLMDFFLAFMEEYRCPMEIKNMIIINFHASSIIKSISVVLKKIYLKMIENKKINEESLQKDSHNDGSRKLKRRRTVLLVDSQNVKKKSVSPTFEEIKKKKIYFNKTVQKLFKNLYFTNEEFSSSSSFQLCCTMYNYFKLTLLQCKDSETLSFWNKIHDIKEGDLDYFNEATAANQFTSDETDYEAYYVFKLFEKISKKVLVKIKEDKPPIYVIYTKPPCLNYLSRQSKIDFLTNVNRSSRNTKLIELMETTEYFKIEAEYNFEKLSNNPFLKKISWMDYYGFSIFIFIVDLALNIYMLAVEEEGGTGFKENNKSDYTVIRIISLIFCAFVLFMIFVWSFTKLELYYKIENAKYISQYQIKDQSHLTCYDKAKIVYRSFFNKGELTSLLVFFVFRIIGSINASCAFTYSFSLLAIMSLSETLNSLSLSLFLKGRQLLWVTVFTFVVLYVSSGWGFYYLRDLFYDTNNRENPENMCESLLYCFLTMINNGFRWYPGIGKVVRINSAIKQLTEYAHNYVYHYIFYLIVRVMLLKIVFGIILDSFRELRQMKSNILNDWKFKCFICNIEKDECEKRNQDFHEHRKKLHNLWDYTNYMIWLRMTDFQDLNGVNTMCKQMILDRQMKWIPNYEKDGDGNI